MRHHRIVAKPALSVGENLAIWAGIMAVAGTLTDWKQQNEYEIYPHWRHRYAPGITHNTEHVFSLTLPETRPVVLSSREHTAWLWLPWQDAADRVFSWSNAQAIRELPQRMAGRHG